MLRPERGWVIRSAAFHPRMCLARIFVTHDLDNEHGKTGWWLTRRFDSRRSRTRVLGLGKMRTRVSALTRQRTHLMGAHKVSSADGTRLNEIHPRHVFQ